MTWGVCIGVQEAQIEALVEELGIDFIVLARYMQIFSEEFCSRHAMHTINIHHSFLPAFEGTLLLHQFVCLCLAGLLRP